MKKKFFAGMIATVLIITASFAMAACAGKSGEWDHIYETKKGNFELLNDTAEHGKVVMIGDSIVELYPAELFDGFSSKVYNRGISGDLSDWMLKRFDTNALKIVPQVLSMLIGTNDLAKKVEPSVIVSNVKQMIEKAQAAGVGKIIIQSVYPVNHVSNRSNSKIIALNAEFSALCIEKGVVYADVSSVLTDGNGDFKSEYTYDGLHPNAAGYIVITEFLKPIFTQVA